jgi:hypothetical protein
MSGLGIVKEDWLFQQFGRVGVGSSRNLDLPLRAGGWIIKKSTKKRKIFIESVTIKC